MRKLNKKSFVVGLAAIAIAVGAAVNVGLFSKKDKFMSSLSLENVEALAMVSIGGMEFMTPQEISDKMNSFTGWNFQYYNVPCALNFQATVTKKGGGLSVGTIIKSLDVGINVVSSSGEVSVSYANWGQKSYCVNGWKLLYCSDILCR